MANRNPNLKDLFQAPLRQSPSIPQQGTGMGNSNHLFENGDIWNVRNDNNTGNQTNFHAGGSNRDSILLSEPPPTSIPFVCGDCQVLKKIVHTNGNEVRTLLLHGRPKFDHAVLEVKQQNTGPLRPSYVKFKPNEVKEFLVQYGWERREVGYSTIKHPLSVFHEDLWVEFPEYLFIPPPSSNSGVPQRKNKTGNDNAQPRIPKTNPSQQRQRTREITLKEIRAYFHLPIEDAARELQLGVTKLRHIYHSERPDRWPYRKIKSMDRQISYWAGLLSSNDPQESARAQNEILRLQQEIENICQGAVGSR